MSSQANELTEKKKKSYQLFNEIAGTYDFLNHLLSCGIDIIWRNRFANYLPNLSKIKALDLACGTGDLSITLAKLPEISSVTGIDLSEGMLAIGRQKVKKKNLANKINFFKGDAQNIQTESAIFDLVTISFGIRNFPSPETALLEINRVLKSGGRLIIIEFSLPKSPLIRVPYLFYLRKILPLIGNLISKNFTAYTYLNETIESFPFGESFLALLNNAHFINAKAYPQTLGIATIYVADKA